MERSVSIQNPVLRWRRPLLVAGCLLLLAGALAFGGGADMLLWGLQGVVSGPLRILALLALFCSPGLALLRLLLPRNVRLLSPAVHLTLAVSISVALPPLLLLLFQQLHLPWNGGVTWAYVLVCTVIAFFPRRSTQKGRYPDAHHPTAARAVWKRFLPHLPWSENPTGSTDLVLLALTGATLLVRLFIVRDVPTGLFGDSYHHTMIARLLVENRGLFDSWQPYAPLASFTYHFGFHTNVAFVHWITGLDVVPSVVWTGQILNALTVPLLFLLTVALGASLRAGVWSALLGGFVSTMPAFYVNWGRYTQLTGHVVLVAVVVCWIVLVGRGPFSLFRASFQLWKPLLLTALVTAALILTHYLVTILAALLVGSYLLVLVLARRSWRFALALAFQCAVISLLAVLLTFPWIVNLMSGHLVRNATGLAVMGNQDVAHVAAYATLPALVPTYARSFVLLAALVGLCIAGWRRQWRVALPALWSVLLVLSVVPYLVGLPGTGIIETLTAFGSLYLTIVPLAGLTLASLQDAVEVWLLRLRLPLAVSHAGFALLLLVVVGWGTGWHLQLINGSTQLVTEADMQAMAWIRDATPPDARFLVNTFPAYGGTLVAGTDAGWWIPLLTRRTTNLPPITYGSETGEAPRFWWQVNHLVEQLRGRPLTDPSPVAVDLTTPAALQVLDEAEIDYVYSGATASPGHEGADYIDTGLLRDSPAFRLVYDRGGVEIFAVAGP